MNVPGTDQKELGREREPQFVVRLPSLRHPEVATSILQLEKQTRISYLWRQEMVVGERMDAVANQKYLGRKPKR